MSKIKNYSETWENPNMGLIKGEYNGKNFVMTQWLSGEYKISGEFTEAEQKEIYQETMCWE